MNRRAALTALVSIPTAVGVSITEAAIEPDVQPGDLVVLRVKGHLNPDTAERILEHVEQVIRPGVKVLVLQEDITLTVHRGIAKVDA